MYLCPGLSICRVHWKTLTNNDSPLSVSSWNNFLGVCLKKKKKKERKKEKVVTDYCTRAHVEGALVSSVSTTCGIIACTHRHDGARAKTTKQP